MKVFLAVIFFVFNFKNKFWEIKTRIRYTKGSKSGTFDGWRIEKKNERTMMTEIYFLLAIIVHLLVAENLPAKMITNF